MADSYLHNTNMSGGASFGSPDSSANAYGNEASFEASDFFPINNDWFDDEDVAGAFSSFPADYNPHHHHHHLNYKPDDVFAGSGRISNGASFYEEPMMIKRDSGSARVRKEIRDKVAFKTKSEIEILDDGFKWRKYGKKMVKNSPNPRNYYRCSVEGCPVKKRVERDKEDRRYVVTTYEGIHNHEGPTV